MISLTFVMRFMLGKICKMTKQVSVKWSITNICTMLPQAKNRKKLSISIILLQALNVDVYVTLIFLLLYFRRHYVMNTGMLS